jgi:SAM-dependent methyltransferase
MKLSNKSLRVLSLVLAALLLTSLAAAQGGDNDKVWREFMDWAKTQSGGLVIAGYRAKLIEGGLSAADAEARIALIPRLYAQNRECRQQMDALTFDKIYRDRNQTSFTTEPNAFLVSATKDLKPGTALDVAMGQGRNAIYLASKGWNVAGFDIAEEGLKLANENAAKAGLRLTTTKSRIEDFDYGRARWDLICLIYVDAPFVDPAFVARIEAALKPGGVLLIDQPFRSLTNPEPGWPDTEQDKPNALPKAWSDLKALSYEDTTGIADWQQTAAGRLEYKARIVHFLARKQ